MLNFETKLNSFIVSLKLAFVEILSSKGEVAWEPFFHFPIFLTKLFCPLWRSCTFVFKNLLNNQVKNQRSFVVQVSRLCNWYFDKNLQRCVSSGYDIYGKVKWLNLKAAQGSKNVWFIFKFCQVCPRLSESRNLLSQIFHSERFCCFLLRN